MKEPNYIEYTPTDFAMDNEFILWVKNPDEKSNNFWKHWIRENPSKALEVSQAIELLKTFEFKAHAPSSHEIQSVWKAIDNHTNATNNNEAKKATRWPYYLKIAAVLVLGIGLFFSFIDFSSSEHQVVDELFVVKETVDGVKSTIKLSDGTVVKLNSGSKLFYSNRFNETTRIVELEGEAYFQVTHNSKKPFIVKTGTIQTKVLGTTFNIRSYSEENLQHIALEEGKIQVKEINNGETVYREILQPSEMLVYNKTNRKHSVEDFDLADVMAWKNNAIVFKNASFKEIQKELERWFGVTIYADQEVSVKFGFTGKFYDETLNNILNNISIAMDFQYEIQNKQVNIYKK